MLVVEFLPTARKGNVFTGVCLSTEGEGFLHLWGGGLFQGSVVRLVSGPPQGCGPSQRRCGLCWGVYPMVRPRGVGTLLGTDI